MNARQTLTLRRSTHLRASKTSTHRTSAYWVRHRASSRTRYQRPESISGSMCATSQKRTLQHSKSLMPPTSASSPQPVISRTRSSLKLSRRTSLSSRIYQAILHLAVTIPKAHLTRACTAITTSARSMFWASSTERSSNPSLTRSSHSRRRACRWG